MTVVTDNNPLAHLQTAKLWAVEQRWVAQLASFDYTIEYHPGKDHTNADVLSRFPVNSTDPTAANQECGDDMLVWTVGAPNTGGPNMRGPSLLWIRLLQPQPVHCGPTLYSPLVAPKPSILTKVQILSPN